MMRHELEERTGPLETWQWEMAHAVYQDHPDIKDVGGKDQIAAIVKQGFDKPWPMVSTIRRMYKEVNGPVLIKCRKEDMYSSWDVTIDGQCINNKPKTTTAVFNAVKAQFQEKYPQLWDDMDYFDLNADFIYRSALPDIWPEPFRIAVFYVRGGSEGYYVHVEGIRLDGKTTNLILAKTLREGEAGIQWAEQTANAISRIMKV
jgi:hypothetical protein